MSLKPIRPNAGIQAKYLNHIDSIIAIMASDVVKSINETYKSNKPELASDASPAMMMRDILAKLRGVWLKKFVKADLAKDFVDKCFKSSEKQLSQTLKEAGFSVPFKMTSAMNDALQGCIGENIALIRSIPEQYLGQVETIVMQGVKVGRDLEVINKGLVEQLGVTKRRAELIARDQTNKTTATMASARMRSIGITQAKWLHSKAGKHPRPSHQYASGKIFDLDKGFYLEGKWVLPGQAINCRCVQIPVIPGLPIKK